jgi:hypothetical protein
MWQRFTERARRVVFFAREEAARLGENYVGTEHLLLGLVREDDCVAARILTHLGISLKRIRADVERLVQRGQGNLGQGMQLTPRAKRVIDLAYEEARQLNNNYIGTEHLLLGLIREGDGLASRVLQKLGAELERVRRVIWAMQEEGGKAGGSRETSHGPNKGDLGILRGYEGHASVEVTTTPEAAGALGDVMEARDHHGYLEMQSAGQFFLVPAGTWVKMLRRPEGKSGPAGRVDALCVRLLDGERAGQIGWVLPARFENQGPDPRPFPPGASEGAPPPPPKPSEPPAPPEKPSTGDEPPPEGGAPVPRPPVPPSAPPSLRPERKLRVEVQEVPSEPPSPGSSGIT